MFTKTKYVWSVFIIILLTVSISNGQKKKGTIFGKVVDAELGEGLLGVNVILSGTNYGAATDLDGEYIIKNIPDGKYTIIYSMVGFEKKIVKGISINDGKPFKLNIVLGQKSYKTDEVIIAASASTNTEAGLLIKRQKSESISDAISSEQISKSGGSNAEDAVKQVVGASVKGNDIFVRGLGDRYTSTQLNGAEIPSVDPYKRSGSIDVIPSSMIENIQVVKSFTPDKRGDFSGGVVDIVTKSFPESFKFTATSKIGYRQNVTMTNNALTYRGGSLDWLGMDDGSRALPGFFGSTFWRANPGAAITDNQAAAELNKATKSFNPTMGLKKYTPPVNQSWGFSFGDMYSVFEKPLGVIGSLTYSNSSSGYADGQLNRWSRGVADPNKTQLDTTFSMKESKFTNNVLWAAMIKTSYKLDNLNIISLNAQYSQNGEKTSRYIGGSYPYDQDPNWLFEARELQYKERNLQLYMISGEHVIKSLNNLKIEWRSSYTKSGQSEPDNRFFYDFMTPDSVFGIKSNLMPERFFRNTSERQAEYQIDLSLPFYQWNDLKSSFKLGGFYSDKGRNFRERRFVYQPSGRIGTYFRNVNGNIDSLFSSRYLGWVGTDTVGQFTMNKIPIYIQETDQTANNYDGSSYISAGYAMFNFPLEKSFKVIGGFRYESTNLHVKSFNPLIPDGLIQTNDFLPSLSLVFSPKENINIRASYGKTLARPTFREISPFMSYDFNGGDTYIGNPSIKRSLIDNGDIRFEWYLKAGEIIAVSAYYKKFVNPIEKVIVDATNKVLSWQNVNKADIYGLEFEFRKRLLFLGDFFSNITLGGNFSYTQSRVQIPQAELSELRVYEPAAKDYRPFQGQSPYIVNLFADYDDYSNGISASLYYNTFGKRLYAIGSIGAPDIYEEPFAMLNFTFSKRLFSNIHLKVSAKNLLDTKQLRTQEFKSHKYVYNSHRYGSVFSVGIKYSIQ